MQASLFLQNVLFPALRLLPEKMDSHPARAMMVAIALQESRIEHRAQINGPARGYWQFELGGGVRGVLTHQASKPYIRSVLVALDYPEDCGPDLCYRAIEHQDILAACFARLLLWTLPGPLPVRGDADTGWEQYSQAWRPGKPHRETWDAFYAEGWKLAA